MNLYNELILKMNIIEEEHPVECEFESDARYTWPERWEVLKLEIEKLKNIETRCEILQSVCENCISEVCPIALKNSEENEGFCARKARK